MEYKLYRLDDPEDLERFNNRMKSIGLSIQSGLFGELTAYLDENRNDKVTSRNAGRHTVITQAVTYTILQSRAEGMTIKDIVTNTGVSRSTVSVVLKKSKSKRKSAVRKDRLK